jgi:hypothetical protein
LRRPHASKSSVHLHTGWFYFKQLIKNLNSMFEVSLLG